MPPNRCTHACSHLPHFHVVFTIPDELAPVALANPRRVYGLLFHAAADTLTTMARDPKRLGANVGFLAVLHTWGQTLGHHPHVHCVVPGGGLAPDHKRWIASRKRFFLPVRVLSRAFRTRFLRGLAKLRDRGVLRFGGAITPLGAADSWCALLDAMRGKEWVVYAKPPFGGPRQVLRYLARYTHRIAIGGDRILFLANRARKKLLPLAQRRAARDGTPLPDSPSTRPVEPVAERDPRRCPACGESAWLVVAIVAPASADIVATPLDTS